MALTFGFLLDALRNLNAKYKTDNAGSQQYTPAMAVQDGDLESLGALADAAWSGSGNGSAIAVLKALVAAIKSGTQSTIATINLSGTGSVSIATAGQETVGFTLSGTWTGTVIAEISSDGGTTWAQTWIYNVVTGLITSSVTANGSYTVMEAGGATQVRVRCSSYGSGTITGQISGVTALQNVLMVANPPNTVLPPRAVLQGLSDGTNIQALLANGSSTLLASATRTATVTTATQTNYNARGVLVALNITAASGTGGLSVRINGVDPISGANIQFLSAATAVTSTRMAGYMIYPGIVDTGSSGDMVQRGNAALPRTWNVSVIHSDSSNYTYSLSALPIN